MKAALRERVLANHEKATDLLVEAVTKNGMTLQQVKSTSSFRAVPFADTVGPGRREWGCSWPRWKISPRKNAQPAVRTENTQPNAFRRLCLITTMPCEPSSGETLHAGRYTRPCCKLQAQDVEGSALTSRLYPSITTGTPRSSRNSKALLQTLRRRSGFGILPSGGAPASSHVFCSKSRKVEKNRYRR